MHATNVLYETEQQTLGRESPQMQRALNTSIHLNFVRRTTVVRWMYRPRQGPSSKYPRLVN
jgi:hypothetical protein